MFGSLLDDLLFVKLEENLGAGQLVEELWKECLVRLGEELSEEHYEIYIRPLQSNIDEDRITLLAPNIYVEEQIRKTYLDLIKEVFEKRTLWSPIFSTLLSLIFAICIFYLLNNWVFCIRHCKV